MKMEVTIERMDHQGRGIGYIDGKIVFVERALPGEIVDIEITKEKRNYNEKTRIWNDAPSPDR